MDNNFVGELLQKVSENEEKSNQKVRVDKPIELFFDLRHLLAVDTNQIDGKALKNNKEKYLQDLCRDNTQLIINNLWQLETKRVDETVVAQLPPEKYLLPRSKPVPKPKAPTKWETYAKLKGIKKTNREKLVWDQTSKEWKPRFGFRGINQNNDWAIEVPQNSDPNADYFQKKGEEKKERIAKNELQRLRNIARSQKIKIAGNSGVVPQLNQSKEELKKASVLAKKSTASVGKFTESLPDEKPPKNSGKKRKFEPNFGDMNKEKDKSLKIIEDIINKKPKLDVNQAIEPLVKNHKKSSPKSGSKRDSKRKKSSNFDKKKNRNNNNKSFNNNNKNKPNINNKSKPTNKPFKQSNKFGKNGKNRKK